MGFRLLLALGVLALHGRAEQVCGLTRGTPAFEAASMKPASPDPPTRPFALYGEVSGGPGSQDPERLVYTWVPLRNVVMNAYGVRAVQVQGPASIDKDRYDIQAKVALGTTSEDLCSMLQTLLHERVGLAVHQEARTFDVYKLSIAPGGTRLVDAANQSPWRGRAAPYQSNDGLPARDRNGLPIPAKGRAALNVDLGYARFRTVQYSVHQLTDALEPWLGKPVVDETELSGLYSYELDFSILGLGGVFEIHQSQASGGVSIFKALEQQLGLKLERTKESLPIVVIDSVQKPTPN